MTYLNIEYFFYQIIIFLKKSYFFVMNMPWTKVYFWAQLIAVILVVFLIAGIIHNIVKINRLRIKR